MALTSNHMIAASVLRCVTLSFGDEEESKVIAMIQGGKEQRKGLVSPGTPIRCCSVPLMM